jgi:uncharacterized RDD family membrane protein YckC
VSIEPTPPPQVSPDGRFYWDGQRWVPMPTPAAQEAPAKPDSPSAKTPASAGLRPQVSYAGFWIRLAAYIVDAMILAASIAVVGGTIGIVVQIALYGVTGEGGSGAGSSSDITVSPIADTLFWFFAFAVTAGYFVYFWSIGGTLGMKLFSLRVVDANTGQPVGIGRAILRLVGFVISAMLCYFGLVAAAFDARKQGWHDKIASSVVLQGHEPAAGATG